MTAVQRVLFAMGQIGVMVLVRFFLTWLLKYASQGPPVELLRAARRAAGPIGASLLERTWHLLPNAAHEQVALFGAAAVGALLFAARVFDAFTDPVAGTLSDRWVARGHERRTLLWFFLVFPSIGLAITFCPGFETTPAMRWALLAFGMFVFFLGYTAYAIPYWSLVDDYGGDSFDDRRVLSNLLGAGILLAVAVVAIASPPIIQAVGFRTAAFYFAVPAIVLMALPYFAAPRRTTAPKPAHHTPSRGIAHEVLTAFAHRRFLAVLLLFAGSQMSFTVITLGAPFLVEQLLHEDLKHVSSVMAPFLGTAIPCFLIAPFLSRRFGWEKACAVASILLGFVYAGTAALGDGVFGLTPLQTAMVVFGCGGPMAAVLLGLEAEAIVECARERDGNPTSLYWGVFNLVIKALNGLAVLITGIFIDARLWRGMGVMAGALLVIGVILYYAVRGPRDAKHAQTADVP